MPKSLEIATFAGQVLVAGFAGSRPPGELLGAAGRAQLGGFILFSRNFASVAEAAELNRTLIEAFPASDPPWIAVDQEGGRVARLGPPVVRLPAMRVMGELGQPDLTRQAAAVLGRQLRLLGFNLDFAPVLDVDSNPDNPVIGDRSFSSDPATVAGHALAFAEGLGEGGVAACGKHFPGHGDTEQDSHLALPRVAHDRERLQAVELMPFRALAAKLPAIMTAHVLYDAIDPALPATLSRPAIDGLLRQQLGFGGVVFSDDLEMKAIADNYGVAEAACLAVRAGCDALLICSQPPLVLEAFEALVHQAEKQSAFALQLKEAASRSLAARLRYRPLPPEPGCDLGRALLEQDRDRIESGIAAQRELYCLPSR